MQVSSSDGWDAVQARLLVTRIPGVSSEPGPWGSHPSARAQGVHEGGMLGRQGWGRNLCLHSLTCICNHHTPTVEPNHHCSAFKVHSQGTQARLTPPCSLFSGRAQAPTGESAPRAASRPSHLCAQSTFTASRCCPGIPNRKAE